MKQKLKLIIFFMLSIVFAGYSQTKEQDELLKILKNEVTREFAYLQKADIPAYIVSYRVDEIEYYHITSSFGVLEESRSNKDRLLTVQVRVGDKNLDNFREIREDMAAYFGSFYTTIKLPIDNNAKAIALSIWEATQKEYQDAALRYEKVKANVAVKVEAEDKAPDYSDIEPSDYYEAPVKLSDFNFDKKEWENRLKKYSAYFVNNKEIISGSANLYFTIERKYFVTSEGTSVVQNSTYCRVYLDAVVQANDGMELPLFQTYFGHKPQDLPNDTLMMNDVKKLSQIVIAMRKAPVVEPYTGPAVLSNDAAGVFFHEIFGHRVEGARLKEESDGQTFKKKVGEQILNKNLSVISDPTIKTYKGVFLNGSYKYDDEGVKGEKVVVVDKGVLKIFLMTRTPIDNFPKSNGHARAQAGFQPVSRQSNLIVQTEKPYTDAQLKKMLIAEAKKQGKEYGYFFAKVQGGFTMTGRYIPNSFNVTPIEVYRVYVDGRPDELVRGVDLVGTPLAMFSQIEAAGDTPGNFAGTCGAESGGIPAGCCSPALFVKQIEMQKKSKEQSRPPIIERP